MAGGASSLENTPTWALSIVCFCFILISIIIDVGFHNLTQFIRKRKRKSLNRALEKIKSEMMTMGFVSLLLTITEVQISKICVREAVANSFHPCKDEITPFLGVPLSSNSTNGSYCEKQGLVSLMSRDGVMQLKILISVVAVFHVLYCILTMFLGAAKMRRWEVWEKETKSLEYQIRNDPTRFQLTYQTEFAQRHLKIWSSNPLLLWPVCFVRQFGGSASKADYYTLRNGFIAANVAKGSSFNFHKFLVRAFDDDFEQIVGIRFWIWIFAVLFIFFSADVIYTYYWLPFIPLLLALAVGTKLQVIITKMCVESSKNITFVRGTFPVKPSNDLFWFNKPKLLLHLLQLILIQNSFQLAFFTWAWFEFGLRSCFNRETADIIIRITTGVGVQFLCGYVTLPIYAIVNQMGSGMTKAVFTGDITEGLENWLRKARKSVVSKSASITRPSSTISPLNSDTSNTGRLMDKKRKAIVEFNTDENGGDHRGGGGGRAAGPSSSSEPNSDTTTFNRRLIDDNMTKELEVLNTDKNEKEDKDQASVGMSTSEITAVEAKNPTGGTYDGEISFGSSWKNEMNNRVSSEITSIIEEDVSIVHNL